MIGLLVLSFVLLFSSFLAMPGLRCFLRVTLLTNGYMLFSINGNEVGMTWALYVKCGDFGVFGVRFCRRRG